MLFLRYAILFCKAMKIFECRWDANRLWGTTALWLSVMSLFALSG